MEEDHSDEGIGESLRQVLALHRAPLLPDIEPPACRQIAGSDIILLNKVDLVSKEQVESTEDIIQGINPAATIYRTVRGEIDLKYIMGIDAYTSRPLLRRGPTHALHTTHDDHDHSTHDHPHPPTHYELRGISSLQVDCPTLTPSQHEKLDEWIRSVLWERQLPDEPPGVGATELVVLRCKGMFKTTAGKAYVLQGVRNLYDIMEVEEGEEPDAGVPDIGKIVLIGKGLGERVRRSLETVVQRH